MNGLSLVGRYEFAIRRRGSLILTRRGKNLMVTTGKNRAASVLIGALVPLGQYLAFGDDSTTPVIGQTSLVGTEVTTRSLLSMATAGNLITQSATIAYGGAPVVVREMGIFSAAAAGTMISRWLPNEFTFGTGDSMEFSWTLEVG